MLCNFLCQYEFVTGNQRCGENATSQLSSNSRTHHDTQTTFQACSLQLGFDQLLLDGSILHAYFTQLLVEFLVFGRNVLDFFLQLLNFLCTVLSTLVSYSRLFTSVSSARSSRLFELLLHLLDLTLEILVLDAELCDLAL